MTGRNWLSGLFSTDTEFSRNARPNTPPRLPFIDDNDCGLGIAVRTYLDDLPLQANSTSPEARADVKAKGKDWFQHSESFTGNLDLAFKLWDAVSPFCFGQHWLSDILTSYRFMPARKMRAGNSRKPSFGTTPISGFPKDDDMRDF